MERSGRSAFCLAESRRDLAMRALVRSHGGLASEAYERTATDWLGPSPLLCVYCDSKGLTQDREVSVRAGQSPKIGAGMHFRHHALPGLTGV
ncbi:protein of unknown function [Bradyrhizobium vignae]|uniref:Uncharacterized protein n=1 Tax=Bradyrhizobium vignae TaxID=1549949 RepID=A0A2U3Q8A6_9BRAD|nr:protein of unknown function [Bradyrhizobium vignae]